MELSKGLRANFGGDVGDFFGGGLGGDLGGGVDLGELFGGGLGGEVHWSFGHIVMVLNSI